MVLKDKSDQAFSGSGLSEKANPGLYDFSGVVKEYDAYRPEWSLEQAVYALEQAGIRYESATGWEGTEGRKPPVVVSIGAGTGNDSAAFMLVGCDVICIDPGYAQMQDKDMSPMLKTAKENIGNLQNWMREHKYIRDAGNARFVDCLDKKTDLGGNPLPEKVDIVVIAQALHALRNDHSGHSEESTREQIFALLPDDGKDRLSVWNYNPNPNNPVIWDLHSILKEVSGAYAQSKTPLLNAEYFRAGSTLPYIDQVKISGLQDVDTVELKESDLEGWLSSYSFGKTMLLNEPENFQRAVTALKAWHDRHADEEGILELNYVGQIVYGPVRRQAFTYDPEILRNIQNSHIISGDNLYVGNSPPWEKPELDTPDSNL